MFDFNENQLSALDLTQHVVLTAAAGSGKTSVLVERFVRLLEATDFEPRKIVALTFTEEAAREMRERVARAVEERAREFGPSLENPWLEVAKRLSQASISTIHGFCLQILRTHFDRIGLDPETRLLSPAEQPVLLDQTILKLLNRRALDQDSDLAQLMESLSVQSISSCLRELAGRRNAFQELTTDHQAYEALEDLYRREACYWILQSGEWKQLSETLLALPAPLLKAPGTMSQRCRDQMSWISPEETLSDFERVSGMAGTLTHRYSPSRLWKESAWADSVRQAWGGLKSVLVQHPLHFDPVPADQEALFQEAVGALGRLYRQLSEDYARAKQHIRAVDFEDLLDLARTLLDSPEVCRRLQLRYPFLLVDEFQDTNQIQWEILRALLGPNSNFMAVGDDKQSIYRFRQADVAVFRQVRRWVARFGKTVEMPENYRSGRRLIEFSNQVFRKLFSGGLDYEALHQEMVVAGGPTTDGQIEVFFSEPQDPIPEPVRVAAWVDHLIQTGRPPSEIAILLRTRNRLKLYEEALSSRRIPFVTVAGAGFFESQEVLDSVGLLRWLANPDDEIALAGVLRSPFFSLSDECLLEISQRTGETLSDKLLGVSAGSRFPGEVAFAGRVLRRLRSCSDRGVPPSRLLDTAFRETGYEHILSASSQSQVRLGNLRKLGRLFSEFEEQRSPSLRRLLRFLDGVFASRGTEPESNPGRDREEGIRIYTIHGAKGLEFPVVVLPELGYPFSASPSDQLHLFTEFPELRGQALAGLLLWNPRDDYRELVHPHFRMLQKLDEYRQVAEEKRLLYVAMTRCKEHLVLIGSRSVSDSYAAWLLDCGAEEHQAAHTFLLEPEGSTDPIQLHVVEPDFGEATTEQAELGSGKPPKRSRLVWSPTQISSFLNCPRRFFLREIDGVPEEAELSLTPPWSTEVALGTAVHEVLERVPELDDPARIEGALRDASKRLLPLQDQPWEVVENRIQAHLNRVRRHPVFDRFRHAVDSASEREFSWPFKGRLVRGVIDRLLQEGNGSWIVVDFKTTRPAPWQNTEAESQQQAQLAIYLGAVQCILKPERLAGLLFFTATGQVERTEWSPYLQTQVEGWIESLPLTEEQEHYPKTSQPQKCQDCPFLANRHCSGAEAVQQTLW